MRNALVCTLIIFNTTAATIINVPSDYSTIQCWSLSVPDTGRRLHSASEDAAFEIIEEKAARILARLAQLDPEPISFY